VDRRHLTPPPGLAGDNNGARLFNSSLDGNVRRAIDIHEGAVLRAAPAGAARHLMRGRAWGVYVTLREENGVNEQTFNLSIRKFLKMVGVNSQRHIEQAVAKAIADRSIAGTESLPARMTLEIAGAKLRVTFDGQIDLQ
jgi:hypothetical protein